MKTTVNKTNANRLNRITLAIAFTSLVSVSGFSVAKAPSNEQITEMAKNTQELKNTDRDSTDLKSNEAQNNAIGLGSGIVFGAVVAGPIGGAIAGIFGLFIADDINDENRLVLTKEELNNKNQELLALQQNYQDSITSANQQIAAMDIAMTQATQPVAPTLEANIQFKTASFLVEDHYKSQLDGLASELRKNPGLTIELSGFADQRGESAYNQVLSQQRAKSVKDYLVSQFVNANQVLTQSFGESELVSESDNFEDNFFDRRVLLKVSKKSAEMTAANH
jgi:peptidoglycan-associated lipoprotein